MHVRKGSHVVRSPLARALTAAKKDPAGTALKGLVGALALCNVASARPVRTSTAVTHPGVDAAKPGFSGSAATASLSLLGPEVSMNRTQLEERAMHEQIVLAPLEPSELRASVIVPLGHRGNVRVFARPGQTIEERLFELAHNDVGDPEGALVVTAAELPSILSAFDDALAVLRGSKRVERSRDMSHEQLEAFNTVAREFGRRQAVPHEAWHNFGGRTRSGGMEGNGSGDLFFGFHREMFAAVEHAVGGNWTLPEWKPNEVIQPELVPLTGRPVTRDPKIQTPGFLTVDGGTPWRGIGALRGKLFSSLSDFQTPDQLGQAIGLSGYHASVHVAVGGVMQSFRSPEDPAFYYWHGHIDHILDTWLRETANGKAWAAANPTDPLLDKHTNITVYDSNETLAAERARRLVVQLPA
jgi:hypothetical protein